MSKYKEVKDLSLAQVATDVLAFWKEEKIFEKSVSNREGAPSFTFYEGPPSANGTPGIHHVMARTVKDIFCRFKTLGGISGKSQRRLGYPRLAGRVAGRKRTGHHQR
ncbi:MAG: class I tRNA ligase family protein [Cytophagales bacterium]|nr:class I tRNA ligase family protein [Cytophagales bacterium]